MKSNKQGEGIQLSTMQLRAVESDARAIVVLASAGSGKTEVVAKRVQRLLESDSGRVLALTYTNKAADELRERLRDRVGAESERVTTETIHGFAHLLVRQHATRIGLPLEPEVLTRDEDRVELLDRWRQSEGFERLDDSLDRLRRIDLLRARQVEDADVDDWRLALASLPALDYPALLESAAEIVSLKSVRRQLERTYTHVVVDEAQNLTPAQYGLLTALLGDASGGPTSMLVGDDKQSIISFAGADPTLIRQFANSYKAFVVELSENFRSAGRLSVLAGAVSTALGQPQSFSPHAAKGIISIAECKDEEHEARTIADWVQGLLSDGLPVEAVADGEQLGVKPEDIAVLGRSVSALRSLGKILESREVPFSASGSEGDWLEGLAGKIVLEIIALHSSVLHVAPQWHFARLLDCDADTLENAEQIAAVMRSHSNPLVRELAALLNVQELGAFIRELHSLQFEGGVDDSDLASWAADLSEIDAAWQDYTGTVDAISRSWADFRVHCSRRTRGSVAKGVQLLTIHKSQGREFLAVAIVGMNEGQIPDFRAKSQKERDSEMRTFYVAVTRARRELLLTRARERETRFGSRTTDRSPYLALAERALASM